MCFCAKIIFASLKIFAQYRKYIFSFKKNIIYIDICIYNLYKKYVFYINIHSVNKPMFFIKKHNLYIIISKKTYSNIIIPKYA